MTSLDSLIPGLPTTSDIMVPYDLLNLLQKYKVDTYPQHRDENNIRLFCLTCLKARLKTSQTVFHTRNKWIVSHNYVVL